MSRKREAMLVLVLFLLVLGLGKGVMEGCYYYPEGSPDLYCQFISEEEAAADYEGYRDYFSPGSKCEEIETCKTITCSNDNEDVSYNAGCADMSKGECEKMGGREITEEMYNEWCSPGCCKTGSFCHYVGEGRWQCLKNAEVQGLDIEVWRIDIFSETECQEKVCGIELLPGTLKGYVLEGETQQPIVEATIELEGEIYPTVEGKYELRFSGTKTIKVWAEGFLSKTETITLESEETKEFNFTLTKAVGIAELRGYITDKATGERIPEATVSWRGVTEGFVLGDKNGFYQIVGLELGDYVFVASKPGYGAEEKRISFTEVEKIKKWDPELEKAKLQGVEGYVYVDEDGDGEGDEEELVYGANVYVDGVFRGYSQYEPLGYYEVGLDIGEHEIYAAYYDYELKEKIKFTVEEGETERIILVLTKYIGECSIDGDNPDKKVEVFWAEHVPGEKEVRLRWEKPCPEVSGYNIYRGEERIGEASPADFSFTDEEVEWGGSYTYQIEAVYTDVELRYSKKVEASITLGDKECEGKYQEALGGFGSFCLVEGEKRRKVWGCDEENKLKEVDDCSRYQPGAWFCAEESEVKAICKDTGNCGWYMQRADPFGLYYERQRCYGIEEEEITKEKAQNYCYFDYTKTVMNRCGSCREVNSCFDYQSKDACEINNCLGTECRWIRGAEHSVIDYSLVFPELVLPELVTSETGHGYCVEEDYEQDDKCGLCGPAGELFENYYCTAEVCSGLGRCFAKADLSRCLFCGEEPTAENNCYAYGTELECIGGQPLSNTFGEITLSQDRCGWGRCIWQGIPGGAGKCVKDGDGDGKEDCESLPRGEQLLCKIDNQAPTTKIVPEGVKIVSLAYPNLTFQGRDEESKMGVLGYCLDSAGAKVVKCTDFVEVDYEGKLKAEEKVLDLVKALEGETIAGETYRLRYYSEDRYANRESVKESFVFVDTELPQFEIGEEISTIADTTELRVYLGGLNEPMACSFELEPVLPKGENLVEGIGREEKEKEVLFEELKGVIYELRVSCKDDYGNVNNKSKRYIFDLEQGINIIYPKGAVRETRIAFEVETLVGASCELYEVVSGNKIIDFIGDEEGKKHRTSPVPGFKQGNYQGSHKVVCRELLTQNVLEDYFDFKVDFSGPETEIVLKEGGREVRHIGDFEEESFVESVEVNFNCPPEGEEEEGFGCEETYYCLTENDYEGRGSPCYVEYNGSFMVEESTNICYYSVDLGGNIAYPACGKILVEGYGIILVRPELYWYEEEQWGISNEGVFDWEIRSKVPTQECKFDFIKEFDYEKVAGQRTFAKEDEHYLIERFPEKVVGVSDFSEGEVKVVYVKCKNLEGEVGPAEKMNLEYDPHAPEITEAKAEPDPVAEGSSTTLYVKTDDKSLCRYDEGEGEYGTMRYKFPGEEENILKKEHEDVFNFNFEGVSKRFELKTQCKNGAGDLSEVEELSFLVDYSISGNIMGKYVCAKNVCYKIEEKGQPYIASQEVTLQVITNKNARCEYKEESTGKVFEVTGGTEHSQFLEGLSEKEYIYPLKCLIGGEQREAQIKFTVDLTPPVIEEVDDGKFSCGLEGTPKVMVSYRDKGNLSSYYYELYERENKTAGTGILIANGTVNSKIPFKAEAELEENHTYYFKVWAVDAAGNWGEGKESDGFLAVGAEAEECDEEEAPRVGFRTTNESCTELWVEMYCEDNTSCEVLDYGKDSVAELCEATESYWQKILFEKTGWLCYYVEDVGGNNASGRKMIEFPDEDGDGIMNHCDKCPETEAGKVVDERGCAEGEISVDDTDKDRLPDDWERLYDERGCELDWMEADSDFDGIEDGDEDYDGDGYTNYEEYKTDRNPCEAEVIPEVEEVEVVEKLPPEIPVEKVNVLAWVLFVLGLLMVLGGTGYLVYYDKFVKPRVPARAAVPRVRPAVKEVERPGIGLKERLLRLRKARAEKIKAREREKIFRRFTPESKKIPHLEEVLRKKGPYLARLEELARKHAEIKEGVRPGLKHGEKGVFDRLESIAEKTKEKKIEEVVSKKEAKNIFDRLKEISKKRKGLK